MAYYDNDAAARAAIAEEILLKISADIDRGTSVSLLHYGANEDLYIRKVAYLAVGKSYQIEPDRLLKIVTCLNELYTHTDWRVRQTVVNAAGEIAKWVFEPVQHIFDQCLFDQHHSVRNAVIGSIKKSGEKNPIPVLEWAKKYLHHPDKEVRREICHGIELRGRKHPQDILPLLQTLEHDTTKRVSKTLVHVLGQIAYKKGCLETVLEDLLKWENTTLVADAIAEIIDVHDRYKNFSFYTQEEAISIVKKYFPRY